MKTRYLATDQVVIGATATLIAPEKEGRTGLLIKAPVGNSEDVYIGNAGVTTSNGVPLEPGQAIPLETDGKVYGISASGGQDVSYAEISLKP